MVKKGWRSLLQRITCEEERNIENKDFDRRGAKRG
jgi:hypothetical protein